jgi:hypothetical protein
VVFEQLQQVWFGLDRTLTSEGSRRQHAIFGVVRSGVSRKSAEQEPIGHPTGGDERRFSIQASLVKHRIERQYHVDPTGRKYLGSSDPNRRIGIEQERRHLVGVFVDLPRRQGCQGYNTYRPVPIRQQPTALVRAADQPRETSCIDSR